MRKIDSNDMFVILPFVVLMCAIIVIHQLIWIPEEKQREADQAKYPDKCFLQRNQTVIQLNANDKITLYKPISLCQVLVGQIPYYNGTIYYYVSYQYESQVKYNKTVDEFSLNCKPKSFDNVTGNFFCTNGTIAKEKSIYDYTIK